MGAAAVFPAMAIAGPLELSPPGIVAAVERTWIRCHESIGDPPTPTLPPWARARGFATGLHCPLFNGVLKLEVPRSQLDRAIPLPLAWFHTQGVPFSWFVPETQQAAGFGNRLIAFGLSRMEEYSGLAMDLRESVQSSRPPPGFLVHNVDVSRSAELFARAIAPSLAWTGFTAAEPEITRWVRGLPAGPTTPLRLQVGLVDGQPVATAMTYLEPPVVGVYAVTSSTPFRGHGVASALLLHTLRAAHSLGARLAVTVAPSGEVPFYRRLGFAEYCRIDRYQLDPATQDWSEGTTS